MTTSGTYGSTTVDVDDFLNRAVRRAGVKTGMITPEISLAARQALYDLMVTMSNEGVNLWAIDRTLVGLYPGQARYQLPVGTLNVRRALYRTVVRQSGGVMSTSAGGTSDYADDGDVTTICTQTAPDGNLSYDFGNSVSVSCVAIRPGASSTLNLLWESSVDGATWTQVLATGSTSYVDNQWYWYDVLDVVPGQYFRVRETGGGTLTAREVIFSSSWTETLMAPLNEDDYAQLVNRMQSGNPLQYWLDRARDQPNLWVWQVPTDTFQCINVWQEKQLQDVGSISNTLDIPQRWVDAVGWRLAERMIFELPGADLSRLAPIQAMVSQAQRAANDEEEVTAPIAWAPDLSPYTR